METVFYSNQRREEKIDTEYRIGTSEQSFLKNMAIDEI